MMHLQWIEHKKKQLLNTNIHQYLTRFANPYMQAFIQALLSTAVFPWRFCFFFYSLHSSLSPCGIPWVDTLSDCRGIACALLNISWENTSTLSCLLIFFFVCSKSNFCWNFRVLWGVLKKCYQERYIKLIGINLFVSISAKE